MTFSADPESRPRPVPIRAAEGGDAPRAAAGPDPVPVTHALLSLNVAVYLVQLVLTRGASLWRLPEHEARAFGGCHALAVIGDHRWETLLTACFLHSGLVHLAFNMLALWQAGPIVERAVGSARMAPMYLVAGVSGNLLSVANAWVRLSDNATVGASGAICGVLAAALVVGWRVQGWKGALTREMLGWLAFVVAFGLVSNWRGGNVDNAAHLGGAAAGALIALGWKRGVRYSARATSVVLALSSGVVVLCIGIVAARDRFDRFALMGLQERSDYTKRALLFNRCEEAHAGLEAVERLRARMAPVTSLRTQVEANCGGDWP